MKTVIADKIGSIAQHLRINQELHLSDDIPCVEGALIAVEVLNNKASYNKLELVSGRMAQLKRGDIIVGALGHRNALFGYSGHLPKSVAIGDTLQLLNIGGVVGVCDSVNTSFGQPFDVKVLGGVLEFPHLGERIGTQAFVGAEKLEDMPPLNTNGVPVVALAGTCMDSGKTAAACAIVSRLRHQGLTVDAFKATGVALRRDVLAMEDAGARNTLIFSDFGVVATSNDNGPAVTRTMLNKLCADKPDAVVFELGDGLLGTYGVQAILADDEIRKALTCVVLCANDPVAAWGGVKLMQQDYELATDVVTGPATDNLVGKKLINERLNVPAFNALTDSTELGDVVNDVLKAKQ